MLALALFGVAVAVLVERCVGPEPELVCRHWCGSPDELAVLFEVARLGPRFLERRAIPNPLDQRR